MSKNGVRIIGSRLGPATCCWSARAEKRYLPHCPGRVLGKWCLLCSISLPRPLPAGLLLRKCRDEAGDKRRARLTDRKLCSGIVIAVIRYFTLTHMHTASPAGRTANLLRSFLSNKICTEQGTQNKRFRIGGIYQWGKNKVVHCYRFSTCTSACIRLEKIGVIAQCTWADIKQTFYCLDIRLLYRGNSWFLPVINKTQLPESIFCHRLDQIIIAHNAAFSVCFCILIPTPFFQSP